MGILDTLTPEQRAEIERLIAEGVADFRRRYEQWKDEKSKEQPPSKQD